MKAVTILFAIVSEGEEEVAFLREDDPSDSFYDEEFLEKDFTSDILFRIGMESDLRMAGYLARRITGDESIEIDEVETESVVENIGHSVRLDALVRDRKGTLYDFEMQGYREEGMGKRMRMYEGSLTISSICKGKSYSEIPDLVMIVFHTGDPYGRGRPLYISRFTDEEGFVTISRFTDEEGFVTDASVVRYEVNLSFEGECTISDIIHDMKTSDGESMESEVLGGIMKSIKENKEMERRYKSDSQMWMERGIAQGFERGIAEGREQGIAQGMEKGEEKGVEKCIEILLRNGLLSPEEIERNFHVPLEEIMSIKNRLSE